MSECDDWEHIFKDEHTAIVKKREVGESCWTGEWRRKSSGAGLEDVMGRWCGCEPWLNISRVVEEDNDVVAIMRKGRAAVWLDGEPPMRCAAAEPSPNSPQKFTPTQPARNDSFNDETGDLIANPLHYARTRLHVPLKPPTLWSRDARLQLHKQNKSLHRGSGGLLSRGMCSSNPLIYPASWRPAVLISVSVDSVSTVLHNTHGDVEPLWVGISCWSYEDKPRKICETFWTSFHSGPFRPDEEEYDSRKEPKSCLLHIPHSVYAGSTPCYLLLKVQRLLTGDDYNFVGDMYKSAKVKSSDAEKLRAKAQDVAERTWVTRTELGWCILPLYGGDVAWGDGMERALATSSLWRSKGTTPADACFVHHLEEDKRKLDKIMVSINLRMEQVSADHVHPLSLSPTAKSFGSKNIRHCYVAGSVMTACAPQLPVPPLPPQQFRNDFYLRIHGLSLYKPKIRSDTDIRTFIVEVMLRTKHNTHAPPVPQCMIDKDGRGLVSRQYTAVSFHQKEPSFDDEFIITLPECLHPDLHIFITIYHISFKKKQSPLVLVGHAFLPIAPNGYLVRKSAHELHVLSAGCESYARIHDGSENYDMLYNERREKDCCDNGKACLTLSVRPVSTLHPNQSTSSEKLATLLNWLPKAVRCTDSSHHDALPSMIDSIASIEVDELLRFFTVVMNFLLALLCKTESEAVLDSILTIFCRVASADPSTLTWYCDAVYSNELVPSDDDYHLWKHLLAVLSSCLKNRRIWGGLAYKEVHRHVFQLVLRSLLLTSPMPDDAHNAFRNLGLSFAEACSTTSMPAVVCITWGETLADLVGVLRGPDVIGILTQQVLSCKDLIASAASIQAFVSRVANPLPLVKDIAIIAIRLGDQLSSREHRSHVLEVIGECFSTVVGCGTFTTVQYQHATTLFTPLLNRLLTTWHGIRKESEQEKERLEIAIKTYKDQVSSMRKFAQSTADHFNGQKTQEFREETTTIAMTIVAKQTALADLEERLDSLLKSEEADMRAISLLAVGILEGSEEWDQKRVSIEEITDVLHVLPEMLQALCTPDEKIEWSIQLVDHATAVILNTCVQYCDTKGCTSSVINTLHLLMSSKNGAKYKSVALGLVIHMMGAADVWSDHTMQKIVGIVFPMLCDDHAEHGISALSTIIKLASKAEKGARLNMCLMKEVAELGVPVSALKLIDKSAAGALLKLENGKEVEAKWLTQNLLSIAEHNEQLQSEATRNIREEHGRIVLHVSRICFDAYSLEEGIEWMRKLVLAHKYHFDSQEASRTHIAVAALLLHLSECLREAGKPALPKEVHRILPHETLYKLIPVVPAMVTDDHMNYYVKYLHVSYQPSLMDVIDNLRQVCFLRSFYQHRPRNS